MIVFGGGFDESKGGGSILGNAFQVVDNVIHGRGGAIRKDFFDHQKKIDQRKAIIPKWSIENDWFI